jgi:hypothetical protein
MMILAKEKVSQDTGSKVGAGGTAAKTGRAEMPIKLVQQPTRT